MWGAAHNMYDVMSTISSLGHYPGYAGTADIVGSASLQFTNKGTVMIDFDLFGVEPACIKPDSTMPNSCGIHIHAGYSCDDKDEPGPHYYNTPDDPWVNVVYKAKGTVARGSVYVNNGASFKQTKGRVMVVHDITGARVTCAKIENDEGHKGETIHVQYGGTECFGENSDPQPGPLDNHHNNVCTQHWCPNRKSSGNCILRDLKGKFVGIAQFDDTISYYNVPNKDKRAEVHVTTRTTYFFEKSHSAVSFIYPFIAESYTDEYNNGHISVNTLAGSGIFNHIGTHGEVDIKVTPGHRVVAIHLPKKKKQHHKDSYGDHTKGYGDGYGDHNKGQTNSGYAGSYGDHN